LNEANHSCHEGGEGQYRDEHRHQAELKLPARCRSTNRWSPCFACALSLKELFRVHVPGFPVGYSFAVFCLKPQAETETVWSWR
jgi:hypothetical protein